MARLSAVDPSLVSAPALLQHPATQASTSSALIDRLPLEEPASVRRILQLLCRFDARSACRSERLLQLLPLLEAPSARELVSCLPQLLGDSEPELTELFAALENVITADRSLTLPSLGALAEVPLSESLKPELARLALDALPAADETDLPTLVRCLMASLSAASLGAVLRSLHDQLGRVGDDTLALVLQVVTNTLRVNGSSARALIRALGGAAGDGSREPGGSRGGSGGGSHAAVGSWTRWDVLLLLQLLPLPRYATAVAAAIAGGLRRGALRAHTVDLALRQPALLLGALPQLTSLAAGLLTEPSDAIQLHGVWLCDRLARLAAHRPPLERELASMLLGGLFGDSLASHGAVRALWAVHFSRPQLFVSQWAILHEVRDPGSGIRDSKPKPEGFESLDSYPCSASGTNPDPGHRSQPLGDGRSGSRSWIPPILAGSRSWIPLIHAGSRSWIPLIHAGSRSHPS